jgi:SulP family sulfate permease
VRADLLAGLTGAVGGVPDGMSAAVLVGVNPVYGLYASVAGPVAGGLASSTGLMVITTTSAAALAAGAALEGVPAERRPDALVLLTLLAGLGMIGAGVARLGRYTRFVSHSVMMGFLTGVAVNIVSGRLGDLTGGSGSGSYPLAGAVDLLLHPSRVHYAALLCGLGALAILIVSARTRLAAVGALIALVVPSVVVALTGADVRLVEDAGAIPGGLPHPHLPDLSLLSFDLVTGALAIVAIVLVQGAGVSQSAAGDEAPTTGNRDFVAQGVGNLAAGLLQGQPVGGSVGRTALNITAGARTRWAAISSGLFMLVILVAFAGLVGKVAMPTLAAVLAYAAARSLRPTEIHGIMKAGVTSWVALVATFVATLFLPVAAAVGVGVTLSLILQLNQEAMDLAVVEIVPLPDGRFVERPAPATLTSHHVIVLDVYGSLLFAGARTLGAKLPDPTAAQAPAVVLRLRGRSAFGSTFLQVVADYARRLEAVGGRLYLSGLDHAAAERLRKAGRIGVDGPVRGYEASELVGESTQLAYLDAETWALRGCSE